MAQSYHIGRDQAKVGGYSGIGGFFSLNWRIIMLQFHYKDLTIEVFKDPEHSQGSADNVNSYKLYTESEDHSGNQVGIKIFKDGNEINSCLVSKPGGVSWVGDTSVLLDDDHLLICCSEYLFCLSVPSLEVKWKTEVDIADCKQVFKLENDYVTHGEISISRIGKDGTIKWQTGGRDIFVSLDGEEEFQLMDDHIILTDFVGNIYKVDFNGESELIKDVELKRGPKKLTGKAKLLFYTLLVLIYSILLALLLGVTWLIYTA